MSSFLPGNMHKISFPIVFLDLQSHFKGNCLLLKKTAVFNNLKVLAKIEIQNVRWSISPYVFLTQRQQRHWINLRHRKKRTADEAVLN